MASWVSSRTVTRNERHSVFSLNEVESITRLQLVLDKKLTSAPLLPAKAAVGAGVAEA